MSQSQNMALKKKPKHIKGAISMSKPYLISFNNENIFNSHNVTKSYRNHTPIKSEKEQKMSVKTVNNMSFVLRAKYRKANNEKIDNTISKKLNYKNGNSFIKDLKGVSKNKIYKINGEKGPKNPFHSRIKSFQIDFKDKYFLNNFNKTEKSMYEEKTTVKHNKINKINNIKENINKDYTIPKNFYSNKTNNYFEDIEDNSTKNTKIFEQKVVTLDNLCSDEKIIILSDRTARIDPEKEMNKTSHNSRQKFKKLNNLKNKSRKTYNNSFYNRNRAFSPSIHNKLNNIRKNILANKEKERKEISSIINKTRLEFSKTKKTMKKEREKQNENKKKINNLIQKIKDKIQNMKEIKNKTNCTIRNDFPGDATFFKERKTTTNANGYNPFQLNKLNIIKKQKKIKISKRQKSPLTCRKGNMLCETKRSENEKDITTIKQIKDNKDNYKINKNIYSNSIVRKVKINRKTKKNKKIRENELDNQKYCFNSKSQNDVFTDFIVKSLNKEEHKGKNNNSKKPKGPKDLEEKKIDKIDNLCQKGFSGPGINKINQDNFFIYNNFMNNSNYIFCGVCDGHGTFGHNVSGYLVYNLPLTINDVLIKEKIEVINEKNTPQIISIIKNNFLEIDKNIALDSRIDSLFSGSTCVSIVYTPSKIICANLGDSRCIIGKYDGKKWFSKNISNDHKPGNTLEYNRIIKKGGRIESYKDEEGNYVGPKRVWLKDDDVPGLAMSRSFGDGVAHNVGVISEPEITEYSFMHEDKFMVLASDGIWEFISNDECVNLIKDFYIKKDIIGALNFLYKEASKRWIIEEEVIDDITLILIFFE